MAAGAGSHWSCYTYVQKARRMRSDISYLAFSFGTQSRILSMKRFQSIFYLSLHISVKLVYKRPHRLAKRFACEMVLECMKLATNTSHFIHSFLQFWKFWIFQLIFFHVFRVLYFTLEIWNCRTIRKVTFCSWGIKLAISRQI